ncbi:MAG: DMT family transporter [Pseudomonadota bacterium]
MNKTALFVCLALGLLWGSNFIFMKWAVEYISATQIVFARLVLGFVPVFIYALSRRQLHWADLRHSGHFLVMACLAAAVYYYGFVRGTELLPSGIAGAVSGSIPLFSVLAAVLILPDEKFTRPRVLGILIGLIGVVTIARPFDADLSHASAEGVAFMVAGSISLGLSFVYARRFVTPLNLSAAALTTYQLGFAALLMAFITPMNGFDAIYEDAVATTALVVGMGLLGTGFAYILYYYIVSKLGAVGASSVTYLPPVVALFIGAILVKEPIEPIDYAASALILGGVFLLNRPAKTRNDS